MRRFIALVMGLIMLFPLCVNAFAAETKGTSYYIDSVSGSDENDGLSPETAWRTIEKANGASYSAGDRILFKSGETFDGMFVANGSGTEEAPVTVSSYGEGERPVIRASGAFVMAIYNVSNWTVENMDFTAPDSYGMLISAFADGLTENITVRNCSFHDIASGKTDTSSAALTINNERSGARIRGVHLDSLSFNNVSWAIHTNGVNAESDRDVYANPEESYNSDFLFENIFIKNACCAGIVVAAVLNCTVRNCRVLDSATIQSEAYAPLWIRHSKNVLIEYCEIAGSTNPRDGMAIDFDGWTVDSTYRYIYSHDNTRFIKNCVFDAETHNAGNEVYNCVSVNDKGGMNYSAVSLISKSRPSFARMRDFSFHDNIIIDGTPIFWLCTAKPKIENITFSSTGFLNFIQRIFNIFYKTVNFSYSRPDDAQLEELINKITENLPEG